VTCHLRLNSLVRALSVASLTIALVCGGTTVVHAADLVDVPDATLAACLKADLASEGIGTELNAANLARLNRLSCAGVGDLTGVSHLTGLAYLNVYGSAVSDLSQLSGLTALKAVWVDSTAALQLTPLATLPNLDKLALTLLADTDATPLADLPKLTELKVTLGAGRTSDFPIPESVTDLQLSKAANLSTLSSAAGVRTFLVSGSLTSLAGIGALPGLTSLTVWGDNYKIANLSPLTELSGLTALTLHSSTLSDLSPLASLTKLTTLDLAKGHISDLSSLAHLSGLTALTLSDNALTSLAPLAGLDRLESLNVSGNQLTDLSPVSGHDSLTRLDAADNQVTTLGSPGSLQSLTSVNLGNNKLTSIAALAGAPLTSAHLDSNKLSDLSPLSAAASTVYISAMGNQISDLSPLPDGASYRITNQDLGRLGEAKVSVPIALGVRGVGGTPLCPSGTSDPSSCTAGSITYPTPGVYHGSFSESHSGSSYSATFSQHAGPDRAFTKVAKIAKLSDLNTQVGASLRSDLKGTWSPAPTEIDRQWYINGKPGSGTEFEGFYYDLKPSDLGKRVKVCITAHLNGYADTQVCSAQSKPVRRGELSVDKDPKIIGTAVVGKTLTLKPGTWTSGTTLRFQWLRNGHAIKGATGLTYRLKAKDARARIEVRVTGTQYGYHSYFVYTKPVRPKR